MTTERREEEGDYRGKADEDAWGVMGVGRRVGRGMGEGSEEEEGEKGEAWGGAESTKWKGNDRRGRRGRGRRNGELSKEDDEE